MEKINKILLPTDFSEVAQNAFRYALKIADKFEVSVEVLHVVYPETEPLDFPAMASKAMQDKAELAEVACREFVELGLSQTLGISNLEHAPVTISDVEIGLPGDVVSTIADRDDIDLIVMGTRKQHGTFDRLFGSVSSAVIRKAPCPVWVVPEEAAFSDISSIVLASNLLETDPFHILQVAEMMESFKPVLRCVHVEKTEKGKTEMRMSDMMQVFEKQIPSVDISFHQITTEGSVVDELDRIAQEVKADLLVMFRSHKNFIERVVRPSLTRQMLFHTHLPMLVL